MQHAVQVARQISSADRYLCDGMGYSVALVDGHGVCNTFTDVDNRTSRSASCVQTEHCRVADEQFRHLELCEPVEKRDLDQTKES